MLPQLWIDRVDDDRVLFFYYVCVDLQLLESIYIFLTILTFAYLQTGALHTQFRVKMQMSSKYTVSVVGLRTNTLVYVG